MCWAALLANLTQKEEEQIDWLHASAENWENTTGYRKMEEIERAFEVVNDCAERDVKAMYDVKDVTVSSASNRTPKKTLAEDQKSKFKKNLTFYFNFSLEV